MSMKIENLEELSEDELAQLIMEQRNLPYTLKVERVDGNKIFSRNSWGNHILYIYKDDKFNLESEL